MRAILNAARIPFIPFIHAIIRPQSKIPSAPLRLCVNPHPIPSIPFIHAKIPQSKILSILSIGVKLCQPAN